ncbi:nuclease-related domain-containing protein [Pseudomonas sp. S2_A02]
MNIFVMLQPLFDILKWLLPLLVLAIIIKTPWFKGWFGELLVRAFAHYGLDSQVYRRLHNVTLDTPDGTTQIDHVFLSPFGIFVLETKNMSGWIFGGERQAQWTQQIFRHRFRFQNPLRQNYKHLKAIEALLSVSPEHVHSVIAFVGGSRFKTVMADNVIQGVNCIRYIKSFQQPVFNEVQVSVMVKALESGKRAGTLTTHYEHVQCLKQRNDPFAKRSCPRCGSAFEIRIRKIGDRADERFWGCSAYPKCRAKQDLD